MVVAVAIAACMGQALLPIIPNEFEVTEVIDEKEYAAGSWRPGIWEPAVVHNETDMPDSDDAGIFPYVQATEDNDACASYGPELLLVALDPSSKCRTIFTAGYFQVTDETLAKVLSKAAVNTVLTDLDLSSLYLKDNHVIMVADFLRRNPPLKKIHMQRSTKIFEAGALALSEALTVNTNLELIDFADVPIRPRVAQAFFSHMGDWKVLREVHMTHCKLTDSALKMIAKHLGRNKSVRKLLFQGNKFTSEGLTEFAKGLAENTVLDEIELVGNKIDGIGAASLAKALLVNKSLKTLKISFNNLGDVGALALAEVISNNSPLTSIDVNNCSFTKVGAAAIGRALATNTHLFHLNLHNNDVEDEGAEGFSEGLAHNTHLALLWLAATKIGDDGIEKMAKALPGNQHLLELVIGGNLYTDKGARALSEGIRKNKRLASVSYMSDSVVLSTNVIEETNSAIRDRMATVTPEEIAKFITGVLNPEIASDSSSSSSSSSSSKAASASTAPSASKVTVPKPKPAPKPADPAIVDFLTKLEIPSVASLFGEHEVDLATLLSLGHDEASEVLKEIGVKVGPRVKILKALTARKRQHADDEL